MGRCPFVALLCEAVLRRLRSLSHWCRDRDLGFQWKGVRGLFLQGTVLSHCFVVTSSVGGDVLCPPSPGALGPGLWGRPHTGLLRPELQVFPRRLQLLYEADAGLVVRERS